MVQLVSFAYGAAALSIAGGGLLVDFTFSEDALRARLLGIAPGCMCRKPPTARSARARHMRDCCSPVHAFGMMIAVIVLSVLQLIQSIALVVVGLARLPDIESCSDFPGYSAFQSLCNNIYTGQCATWRNCYNYNYYYYYDYNSFLTFYRYLVGTSVIGAICCVAQLVAASTALVQLIQLQRLTAASMPDAVGLLGCCVCCEGSGPSSWSPSSGPVLAAPTDPYVAPSVHTNTALAPYPRSYWTGEQAAPQTGHGMQALTAKSSEALHTGAGAGAANVPAGDLRAPEAA